ncbi:MAG TPA: DUF951 domain-containing protein [Candidatus Gallimonas gallistercoris]|uniref:DUF951 domain-containing protein n=1 Tax=Candidatus Gallimonas gallistercoris TaxID=2838602 RepID=A0A9D2KE76_9FIRM|nr:DUF951 domain-containing protein [Candidatus Gallimonas gallistercoris]
MYSLGDIVETKKTHPCGGNKWEVVRTGADYKLKCLTCGRLVMLTPDELKKRVKRVLSKEE